MDTPSSTPSEGSTSPASLASKLMNVFAAPGDVFDEVTSAETRTKVWLVPVLLSCLVGIIYSVVVFSQDSIVHSIREAQEIAVQKQVAAGKITQQQADQAASVMEIFRSPAVLKTIGSVGAVVGSFAYIFLIALAIFLIGAKPSEAKRWPRRIGAAFAGCAAGLMAFQVTGGQSLVSRLLVALLAVVAIPIVAFVVAVLIDRIEPFGGSFSYMKAVEIAALSGMISVLGGVVSMLLAVLLGSLAMTPGPVLLVHDFDPADKIHALLSQLNLFTLWYIGVLSLGLAKLSRASFGKAATWLFAIWAVLVLALTLPGWGR